MSLIFVPFRVRLLFRFLFNLRKLLELLHGKFIVAVFADHFSRFAVVFQPRIATRTFIFDNGFIACFSQFHSLRYVNFRGFPALFCVVVVEGVAALGTELRRL